jgi:hypothetical protein
VNFFGSNVWAVCPSKFFLRYLLYGPCRVTSTTSAGQTMQASMISSFGFLGSIVLEERLKCEQEKDGAYQHVCFSPAQQLQKRFIPLTHT